MALTKTQINYLTDRINQISRKKEFPPLTPFVEDPARITSMRVELKAYDDAKILAAFARRELIITEKNALIDSLHLADQANISAALLAFENKQF